MNENELFSARFLVLDLNQTKVEGSMYQLYIGNRNYSSWSLRPWLLMKYFDLAFEECFTDSLCE